MRAGVGPFVLAYPSGAATITDMGEIVAMIFSRRNPVFLRPEKVPSRDRLLVAMTNWVTGRLEASCQRQALGG